MVISIHSSFPWVKTRHFTQPKSTGPQAAFYAWRRRAKRQREVLSILLKQEQFLGSGIEASKNGITWGGHQRTIGIKHD